MELEDQERLERMDKELKEFERWKEQDLVTEIAEGKHMCLFYFGKCVCGRREEDSK